MEGVLHLASERSSCSRRAALRRAISALMRRDPDAAVVSWLDGQPTESMWTTSITVFEVTAGLRLLPAGRRRQALEHAFDGLLAEDLDGRVQTFDTAAAMAASEMAAQRQAAGRPLAIRDVQIAGIALARGG